MHDHLPRVLDATDRYLKLLSSALDSSLSMTSKRLMSVMGVGLAVALKRNDWLSGHRRRDGETAPHSR